MRVRDQELGAIQAPADKALEQHSPALTTVLPRFGVAAPSEASALAVLYAPRPALSRCGLEPLRRLHRDRRRDAGNHSAAAIAWIMTFVQAPQAFAARAVATLERAPGANGSKRVQAAWSAARRS